MNATAGQLSSEIELEFTPPFDWMRMLRFFNGHAAGSIERIQGDTYLRTLSVSGAAGVLNVRKDPARNCLIVRIDGEASQHLGLLHARLSHLFDLALQPDKIRTDLGNDPWLEERFNAAPGLRVPGTWSGFELVVRAIVGQQVSVKAAATIVDRLVQRAGININVPGHPEMSWLFPTAQALAEANLDQIGMPTKRVASIQNLARLVYEGVLDIEGEQFEPTTLKDQLLSLPGIGPWTVEYIAMRAWRDPDAWPGTDLILMQAIKKRFPDLSNRSSQLKQAQSWRPWRAYVAMHLWNEIADQKEPLHSNQEGRTKGYFLEKMK